MMTNLLFSCTLSVRVSDLNYGNHLCHTKLISLLHQARALFLNQHQLSELNCYGVGLVMLNLTVNYASQAFFNDPLAIKLYLPKLAQAKLALDYSVENCTTGKLTATAHTVMGFYDKQKNRLTRMPKDLADLLELCQTQAV